MPTNKGALDAGWPAADRLRARLMACLDGVTDVVDGIAGPGDLTVLTVQRGSGEGGRARGSAVGLIRTLTALTIRLEAAMAADMTRASATLDARAAAAEGVLASMLAKEQEIADLSARLPRASDLRHRAGESARRAVGRADQNGDLVLRSAAELSLLPARPGHADSRIGRALGRDRDRVFTAPQQARAHVGGQYQATVSALADAIHSCLAEAGRLADDCHASAVTANSALRDLAASLGAGVGGPGAPPSAPATAALAARDAQVAAATALHAVLAAAIATPATGTSLFFRLTRADSYPGQVAATASRAHHVSRTALTSALTAAWRQLLAKTEEDMLAMQDRLWRGPTGRYLRQCDARLDEWQAFVIAAQEKSRQELADVERLRLALRDYTAELAEIRKDLRALAAGPSGRLPDLLRWVLADAAGTVSGYEGHNGYGGVSPAVAAVLAGDRPEARVPIVAPMSAGKSTLLNALLGQEILPTRNTAMTCLPTSVVMCHPAECPEPRLILPEVFLAGLHDAADRVRTTATIPENARIPIERHSHLADLLDRLRGGRTIAIKGDQRGATRIQHALTQINDLIRLALLLDPQARLPAAVLQAPRVLVPVTGATASPGRTTVVLVDTPAPDEVRIAEPLQHLIQAELAQATAVILVIDFARLDAQAGALTSQLLAPVREQISDDGLWVVVNRIDQRRFGDRDAAGVRRFVQQDLGLAARLADERTYETAAWHALVAQAYLGARPADTGTGPADADRWTVALLEARYPGDWQDRHGRTDPATLRDIAGRLLDNSGVPRLREPLLGSLFTDGGRLAGRAAARQMLGVLPAPADRSSAARRLAADLIWSVQKTGRTTT